MFNITNWKNLIKKVKKEYVLISFILIFSTANMVVLDVYGFSDEIESLLYSSFFGGSLEDKITDFEVDRFSCIFGVGGTFSDDLPTTENAFQVEFGGGIQPDIHTDGGDGFLFKMNTNRSLAWCTYFGGSSIDYINSIDMDIFNNIIISGYTMSNDFPVTLDAFQSELHGEGDGFIAKFSDNGTLLYSSYFGGESADEIKTGLIDETGNYCFIGHTLSTDLNITQDAIQSNHGGNIDIFISKFDESFQTLIYSSYWGSSSAEITYDAEKDGFNNLFINGVVIGDDLITKNPKFTHFGGNRDAFIAKFNQTNHLLYSTYFGGEGFDDPFGSAVDNQGNFHFSGRTSSSDYPLQNAYQSEFGGDVDATYSVLSADGTTVEYSSYFGGTAWETIHDITVTDSGKILACGFGSSGFPAVKPFSTARLSGNNLVLMQFSSTYELEFSTRFGNYEMVTPFEIIYSDGDLYIVGRIGDPDFYTSEGAFQNEMLGDSDGFILKFDIDRYLRNYSEPEESSTIATFPVYVIGCLLLGISIQLIRHKSNRSQ